MTPNHLDELLARKREAAREVVNVDEATVKLVIFELGERFFAFRGEAIREVLIGSERLFFVPGMPASVEGVINVRGDIVSVILLYSLLQLDSTQPKTSGSSLLLAEASGMQTGVRVDSLLDVVDWPLSQLKQPPESLPEGLQPYVEALFHFSDKAVALLDIDKVFADYQEGLG